MWWRFRFDIRWQCYRDDKPGERESIGCRGIGDQCDRTRDALCALKLTTATIYEKDNPRRLDLFEPAA
jgi:hypothetical protein